MMSVSDYHACADLDPRYDQLEQLGIVSVLDEGGTYRPDPTYTLRYRIKLDVAAFCKWVESSGMFTQEELNNLLFWVARDGIKQLGL